MRGNIRGTACVRAIVENRVTQKRYVRLHVVALFALVIQSASNPSANEMAFAASFIFQVVRCEMRPPMLPFGTV
jgi:hypothetical protein